MAWLISSLFQKFHRLCKLHDGTVFRHYISPRMLAPREYVHLALCRIWSLWMTIYGPNQIYKNNLIRLGNWRRMRMFQNLFFWRSGYLWNMYTKTSHTTMRHRKDNQKFIPSFILPTISYFGATFKSEITTLVLVIGMLRVQLQINHESCTKRTEKFARVVRSMSFDWCIFIVQNVFFSGWRTVLISMFSSGSDVRLQISADYGLISTVEFL